MYDLLVKNARIYPMHWDAAISSARTLAVNSGRIAALGVPENAPAKQVFDAANRVMLPGFVDCHTHALYAGNRMAEHALKLRGAGYEELARAGGGIQITVDAVRAASEQQLVEETLPRLKVLLAEGVTTIEIKSGYGLDLENELKMLRAIRLLRLKLNMDVVPTFLGAHAIPRGGSRERYIAEVIEDMLPVVAREKLAENVDIFAESMAFSVEDLRLLFIRATALGLKLRAHTDQLSHMGATAEAAVHGALSCDHLEYATEEDVLAMRQAGTVAVLLPGAFYFLRETRKPPLELLRRHQVSMAVATDLNPGSSPIVSLLAVMHMSAVLFGLTPAETLLGVTRNAAQALGRADKIGSLVPGLHADFSIWDIPSPDFICYQLGGISPDVVFFKGNKL
ncbi:MAG: imidazolonepropionase [Gammaproteobacteria bacterium]|nr:imidazolonepropionase [Gammaproteobacteria bacterium]MDE2345211.1 imidazolonepropionase [Gammaproteobacteria bacterium]